MTVPVASKDFSASVDAANGVQGEPNVDEQSSDDSSYDPSSTTTATTTATILATKSDDTKSVTVISETSATSTANANAESKKESAAGVFSKIGDSDAANDGDANTYKSDDSSSSSSDDDDDDSTDGRREEADSIDESHNSGKIV